MISTDSEEEQSDEGLDDAAERLDSGIDATVLSEQFHAITISAAHSEHRHSSSTEIKQVEQHRAPISKGMSRF